jgi:ribonuclease G
MAKEICISSTPHETRLAILEDDQLTEIYYERENEYTLAGSIYKGRVTRVLPGMQSAFVDLGLERDAFLYVTDFMEEQEDGADFEKVPGSGGNANGGGGGNGGGRREPQASREPQAARAPREPRESGREPRVPRTAIAIEPEIEDAAGSGAPIHTPGEGPGKEEEFGEGTRRWRGRRGRRRGGRPREAGSPQSAEARPSLPVSSIEIEIEDGPTVYEDTVSPGSGQAAFSERIAPPSSVAQASSASQPIVLPGESLSRYGGKPADSAPKQESRASSGSTSAAASGTTYKPSTLVEVVPGWDGGAELPGESLSRYRGKAAATPPPATSELVEHAWEVPASGTASVTLEQLPEEAAETTPAIESHSAQIEGVEPVFGEPATPEALAVELPTPVPFVESAPSPEAPILEHHEVVDAPSLASEVQHEEEHFEPENASASYRIDPSAPSEYRVSAVVEEEPELHSHVQEPAIFAPEDAAEPAVASVETVHAEAAETEHLPAQGLGHIGHVEAPAETSAVAHENEAPASAVAYPAHSQDADPLLESSGELEEPHGVLEAGAGAAVEELPQISETEFVDEDEFEEGAQGFAPGAGTLEEEVINEEEGEEEYDTEPIRAYSDEGDLDDLEEETLDNLVGAELSEMVRDAHLEKRISVSPDALEEEDSELDYGEAESDLDDEEGAGDEQAAASSAPAPARRDGGPGDGRTDDGRRGGRGPRRRGRPNGGGGGGSRRANSQLSDLPIISELLKQGQEILVQIAKEPIAKKGARITSHIALPGRFLVFMPTVNHVGVSRKISSDEERQRLKRILVSEKGAASGGFIVRTAADGASEDDLRADIRFLISLWNDIKQRADDGKAPALIYHDLNLIERVLRDQVSANFATIWVDNEAEYERIVRFLSRFEPSLVRRVKLYTKETPLFEQFGIQDEIGKALKSKVWLKSGGSIVINQTEALVAIDINTGKYVGKTARLEDTILKTNLDAIPEIVRQIRLRDLGGIIVIDFIDMDDRRNRHKVMAALEEELKSDRAPSKVLQFNDFGLVAITRKRVKQSLERTLSVQCDICAGTGMVKSPTTVCNEIYTELRKMQRHLERGDVLLRVHPEVVKTLKANNAKWLNELEEMTGKTIIVKSDPALHPEQFDIH